MKNVSECANLFLQLINKDYYFTIEGGIKFKLFFTEGSFVHLLGLGKLIDIKAVKENSPGVIFKQILDGTISDSVLSNSKFYYKISDRVNNFEDILSVLDFSKCNKIIVDFDASKLSFKTLLNKTKYILYKTNTDKTSHLTLGQNKARIYPETFMVEAGNQYLSDQTMLDIIDIKIKEHNKKKERQQ